LQFSPVIQSERHGDIPALVVARVNQHGSGKSRLNHQRVPGGEIENDEFSAPPGAQNSRSGYSIGERTGADLAQHVGVTHTNADNRAPGHRAVEIPRDRLGLR
jgi:hypothetical protein